MMMRPRSLLPWRGHVRAAGLMVLLVAALQTGGCVTHGDFGRLRPELVADNMHDSLADDAMARVGGPISEFRTTDQERELRDRAYALIKFYDEANPWGESWGESWGGSWGWFGEGNKGRKARARKANKPVFDRTAYLLKLHQVNRRSEASAYAQIVTDARGDVEMLQPFFAVAERVADMDRRRAQALTLVSTPNPRERANAVARNRENAEIVAWVCQSLRERAVSYRYALERLVIAVPSPAAAEADRSIELFVTRIAHYCNGVHGGVVTVRG
jgi:hypothetical protein